MPKALCVGNGNLQVNIDYSMNIRDIFFPFIGLKNHVSEHFCRFGVARAIYSTTSMGAGPMVYKVNHYLLFEKGE